MTSATVRTYQAAVVLYAINLPFYFYFRWSYTIEWEVPWLCGYQTLTCCLELYGALNVLLLGLIRFPCPWAPGQPMPPDFSHLCVPQSPRDRSAGTWSGPYVVSILIPCCNEPDDVIFGTVRAALALEHPLASEVHVYLLDDGGIKSREEQLLSFGDTRRVHYVSRPKNPKLPRHGKAGNLNYALRGVLFPNGQRPHDEQVAFVRRF